MKNPFIALLFLALSLPIMAQVDAKLNVGSAITLGANVAAEFPLGTNSSLSTGLAYSGLGLTIGSDDAEDEFKYRNFRFIPEYRYYFSPREGFDRFFVGGYGKIGRLVGIDKSDDSKVDATRAALGIMSGHKWVSPSGFVFELNAGVGRALTFGGGDGDAAYERAIGTLTAYDLRLGILVGWRLGQ